MDANLIRYRFTQCQSIEDIGESCWRKFVSTIRRKTKLESRLQRTISLLQRLRQCGFISNGCSLAIRYVKRRQRDLARVQLSKASTHRISRIPPLPRLPKRNRFACTPYPLNTYRFPFVRNLVISLQAIEANNHSGYIQSIPLRWIVQVSEAIIARARSSFAMRALRHKLILTTEAYIAADVLTPLMPRASSTSALAQSYKPSGCAPSSSSNPTCQNATVSA